MVEDIVRKNGLTTLGSRLRRLGERLQSEVQDLFDQSELPIQPFQYPLLLSLNDNGAMEIGQIARALGVTQPGVTRSVAQLTDLGCVEIIREVHDKRVRRIDLTDLGRTVVTKVQDEIAPDVLAAFYEILDADAHVLLSLLDRLENGLNSKSFIDRAKRRQKEVQDD